MAEKVTINHEEIQAWVEKHHGTAQLIDEIDATGDSVGIRIDFPGTKDDMLIDREKYRKATWEDWFKVFEQQNLAFGYDDEIQPDDQNRLYRFEKRL